MTQSPESVLAQLELVKSYLATFQTCKNCGACFQNRNTVYHGTTPLCKHCRETREHIILVHYHIQDQTVSPPIKFSQCYAIPMSRLSTDFIVSLNALHNTTILSKAEEDEHGVIIRRNKYKDFRGSLFHEHFPPEWIYKSYNPRRHDVIKQYEFGKAIL